MIQDLIFVKMQKLVGYYKLILCTQCTRIFWPLRPGNFLRQDRISKISNWLPMWKYHHPHFKCSSKLEDTWAVSVPKSDELNKIQVFKSD